jgi:hypothetical protein
MTHRGRRARYKACRKPVDRLLDKTKVWGKNLILRNYHAPLSRPRVTLHPALECPYIKA